MRKIFTTLAVLLACFGAGAQQVPLSYAQYETAFNGIDAAISNFIAYSKLNDRKAVTPASQQRFRALFAPGATIDDALCQSCQVGGGNKSVDEWVTGLLRDFPKGLETAELTAANIDYSGMNDGRAVAFLERRIVGARADRQQTTQTDRLQVQLLVDPATQEVRIASVRQLKTADTAATLTAASQQAAPVAAIAAAAPPLIVPAAKDSQRMAISAARTRLRAGTPQGEPLSPPAAPTPIIPIVPPSLPTATGSSAPAMPRPAIKQEAVVPATAPVPVEPAASPAPDLASAPETPDQAPAGMEGAPRRLSPGSAPRFFAAIQLRGGLVAGKPVPDDPASNYDGRIAAQTRSSELKLDGGGSLGADVQLAYFFGQNRRFGIGTGLMFQRTKMTLKVDDFAVDFRNTDRNGNVFRQRIRATEGLAEQLTVNSLSIPLVLKTSLPLHQKWSFTADIGVLLNVHQGYRYATDVRFDYEAFYLFDAAGNAIYDMGDVPAPESWMISRANYEAHGKAGQSVEDYFNSFEGYNVGLSKAPAQPSGKGSFRSGSIGWIVQPGVAYQISRKLWLQAGLYAIGQAFSNSVESGNYRPTIAVGTYHSITAAAENIRQSNFGLTIGLRAAL